MNRLRHSIQLLQIFFEAAQATSPTSLHLKHVRELLEDITADLDRLSAESAEEGLNVNVIAQSMSLTKPKVLKERLARLHRVFKKRQDQYNKLTKAERVDAAEERILLEKVKQLLEECRELDVDSTHTSASIFREDSDSEQEEDSQSCDIPPSQSGGFYAASMANNSHDTLAGLLGIPQGGEAATMALLSSDEQNMSVPGPSSPPPRTPRRSDTLRPPRLRPAATAIAITAVTTHTVTAELSGPHE